MLWRWGSRLTSLFLFLCVSFTMLLTFSQTICIVFWLWGRIGGRNEKNLILAEFFRHNETLTALFRQSIGLFVWVVWKDVYSNVILDEIWLKNFYFVPWLFQLQYKLSQNMSGVQMFEELLLHVEKVLSHQKF